MFGLSKIVALILAFTIGFSLGAGAFFGGIAIALSSFTVRDLERNGIPIPDEAFIGENPEVDILDLTLPEFLDELKELQSLGDTLTINRLRDRYALIFPDIVDNVLSDDTCNMPLGNLFGEEGINTVLSSVYIGALEQYECRLDTEDGFVEGDPADENSYWVTRDGKRITVLEEKIADYNLADFMNGNINTNDILNELTIGNVLGYTQKEGDDAWYDSEGNKVTGIIAAFAGSTINTIGDDIDGVTVGQLLGYEKNEDDEWVDSEGNKITGVIGAFAGSTFDTLSDDISDLTIAKVLGYEKDESGNLVDSEGNKVTGVLSVFADCAIDGVGNKMKEAKLAELLGYEFENNKWVNADGEELTGALAALADCNLEGENSVTNKINTVDIGKLLGYEFKSGKWYETKEGSTTSTPVNGLMNKIASSSLDNVGDVFNTLVIDDIVEENKRTGIFKIVSPDTKITEISAEIEDSIKESPLQFFINENLITFDASQMLALDNLDVKETVNEDEYNTYYKVAYSATANSDGTYSIPKWRTVDLSQSFSHILSIFTK